MYDQVFSDDILADDLLVALRLLAKIEVEKRKVQASIQNQEGFDMSKMFLIDGAYHVLFAVGQIADKYGIDRLDLDATSNLIPDAINLLSGMVGVEQKNDEAFSFNRYFKDSKTKTKIAAHVENIIFLSVAQSALAES